MEQAVLLAKAQQGDREALQAIVTSYWQPVYRLVYRKVGNAEDAQDLTQETFYKALRALARYQSGDASFQTYLGRIALNTVTDFWRKQGRAPEQVELSEYQQPLADTAECPEEYALRREQRQELQALMDKLPSEQRRAVDLRIMAGLSVREAAEKMGKTEAALKMLQQRALQNLRTLCRDGGLWGGGDKYAGTK